MLVAGRSSMDDDFGSIIDVTKHRAWSRSGSKLLIQPLFRRDPSPFVSRTAGSLGALGIWCFAQHFMWGFIFGALPTTFHIGICLSVG